MQLLIPRLLLCLDGNTEVLENHAVLIDGERVAEVGPALTLLAKYPEAEKIELPDQVLMPGLINCHTHAAMNLFRGIADDLALHDWLQTRIWPLEGAHADQEFVYDGTVMSAAEMLLGGTTTFNDMYFYPDQVVQAAIDVGIRVVAGITVIEFPTRYASDANQYIELGLAARDKTLNEATVHWSAAPHAPYTVSDDTFLRLASLAEELNLPIHCHLHETASEVTDAVSRNGVRPFDRLLKLGVINERFMAVHGVHLNDSELAQMSKAGASLVHCPASNLKLASGIAPISTALKAGVNVVVGTDGAASNNKIDMWDEMRLAALLCKGASMDATAWTASEALLGVTNGAAKALGLESVTGRISAGFKADLIAVELDQKPHQSPLHNLVSKLVYSGSARDVAHVWVNGKRVVESQQLVGKSSQLVSQTMRKVTRVWQTRLQ
ncbi:amidohydrolase family protein [Limnobacter litoralis]|uniref:5-methylthioadenosine/S-adenosylhomocysteine deaminase n=1 Tax=Limnobacter litoralis TaxID=481366 RepID=A0ABQ5YN63_9BURK|nr:amidohydrolase family protein [Limnobacter litoralis]GLR26033.1 5-methylthioadenosine/S-adenosylhomocysteine deaminase [Limnobacter litoralis]